MPNTSLFKDLKIIDLSTVLAGPSVGSFFAELGADVIKVENSKQNDITRSWKLPNEDKKSNVSAYFSSINYKKKYQFLDLKNKEDHAQLLSLIQNADIVLMNYKKGDQEKLNISDKTLHKVNPQLIIGKINGFGVESDRVAYDLILQAESGFMSMNGTPESGPIKMPIALIDVLTAHHLKEGILIELLNKSRDKDYKGTVITASLYDAAVISLVNQASNYLMTDHVPQRIGSLHPNIAPYGELFKTKDGKTITFAIGSNRQFKGLCSYFDLTELPDDKRFSMIQERVQNRKELYLLLKEKVIQFSAEEILSFMHGHFVPCGEVKDLEAVFKTEAAKSLVRTEEIDGEVTKRVTGIGFKRGK